MSQLIEQPTGGMVAADTRNVAAELRERVNLVQRVMREVMKEGTHYGTIPGTNKPTLYKAGAEMLCVAFRIGQEYVVEDLSTRDAVRYRVRCVGRSQVTGGVLGEGVGECASDEEKYKWRGAVCAEEFDDTPETYRRIKYVKFRGGSVEKKKQIKTDPADMANTVLKMACKRAFIAMTLNVTAASDMFTQDIEDMPEELRPSAAGQEVATDLVLREKWITAADAAEDEAALKQVWSAGLKEINAAQDMPTYQAFKAAVAARGAALKQAAAAPAADAAGTTDKGGE